MCGFHIVQWGRLHGGGRLKSHPIGGRLLHPNTITFCVRLATAETSLVLTLVKMTATTNIRK